MENILDFLHLSHQMKRIQRFKDMPFWKNSRVERWDSNAEHTYRMSLIAILLKPYLKKTYDYEKLLTMIVIHDLVEVLINDKFPFKDDNGKYSLPKNYVPDDSDSELLVFNELFKDFSDKEKYQQLFKEFVYAETGRESSDEAKLAVALDRIESSLQVSDYIRLNEFSITSEHSKLQIEYLKSKVDSNKEPALYELVGLIEKELMA